MSFWWVNHKQTYDSEIKGGYIWSPKTNSNGGINQTYLNLTRTKPNDIIFSYANTKISAVGIITSYYKERIRPPEFGRTGDLWSPEGWSVSIEWTFLDKPITPKQHIGRISPLLPKRNSPIQNNGNGNQGCYLASISDDLGNLIISLVKENDLFALNKLTDFQFEIDADVEENRIRTLNIDETEKEQLIKARKGQGIFRINVERIEIGCRLTKIREKQFLMASHIKPWKDSLNTERLDGFNGLLLSPHVDRLFDRGWISFTNHGKILCEDKTVIYIMKEWGLRVEVNVGPFKMQQCKYLEYHRDSVFNKSNKK